MQNDPIRATAEGMPAFNRQAIMTEAWACYRAAYGNSPRFHRDCFAVALKMEWRTARFAANRAAERAVLARPVRFMGQIVPVRPMSEMEQRIDALKYESFRVDIAAEERRIRAQYATAA